VIRVITYFGGSFLPLRQSKALYKVGFFEEITGDLQKKAEFATRIINTSALHSNWKIYWNLATFRKSYKRKILVSFAKAIILHRKIQVRNTYK
jgi:hypothetical protein